MGHGSSRSPAVGAPANPRVGYAHDNSKLQNRPVLIDAPILVKLQSGSVRYRYLENDDLQTKNRIRVERPHEGPERKNKSGYFFHANLNDFSEDASYDKEEIWKFSYVYKGADKSHQKTLYYVFGKGLKPQSQKEDLQTRPQGKGYKWPSVYKQHGHLYFDITVLPQEGEIEEESETEDADLDAMPDSPPLPLEMSVQDTETLIALKRRLAIRFIKPQGIIHLYQNGKELSQQNLLMSSLRSESDEIWKVFRIHLQ
uniref:Ubiquitin-like domain-containing protein n=1 Tax=Capitella teleta TaxID=283909 RepID=X2ATU5_CAPTE